MKNKLISILRLSLYEKYNYISINVARLKTQTIYRFFFHHIGGKSIIKNPLFLKNICSISIGDNVFIRDHARIECVNIENMKTPSPYLIIEDSVSIEQRCHITAASTLIIGRNTIASFDVMITNIDHEYTTLELPIANQPLIIKKTQIGENCFIGSGAKIQAGTILGKHCVVGTNAVVRGIFPDYCVIVGTPAKIIKRYNEKTHQWDRTNDKGEFLNAG